MPAELANIRHIAIAIRDGLCNAATLQECPGIDARRLASTRVAAEMLGFITVGPERLFLTALGERLLTSAAGSAEEREIVRQAVVGARALRPFRPLGSSDPAHTRLADRLCDLPGMTRSSARRRAGTLIRCRQKLDERARQRQPGLGLPSLGEEIGRMVACHNAAAKQRVLDRLAELDPKHFERLVGELMRAMGYTEVRVVGRSGDGGVDVEATIVDRWSRRCGVAAQAKRWSRPLGRKPVDELLGVLVRRRCDHGILITTSSFSREARRAADEDPRLRLVDGTRLVDLLAEHGVLVGFGEYGELIELAGRERVAASLRPR